MPRNCKLFPAIHDKVLALINHVIQIHDLGTGAIDLSVLLDTFGLDLAPAELEIIKDRNLLTLTRQLQAAEYLKTLAIQQ